MTAPSQASTQAQSGRKDLRSAMPASATKEQNEMNASVQKMRFPIEQARKEEQEHQHSQKVVSKRQRVSEHGDLSPRRLFEEESESYDKHSKADR